jgi:hypothetical protein
MSVWKLEMTTEPVIPAWTLSHDCRNNGAELQRAIIKGFSKEEEPVYTGNHREFTFEKVFTFKEHGEFFRGALTMARLRYSRDFYELLERYGSIKVTIDKREYAE